MAQGLFINARLSGLPRLPTIIMENEPLLPRRYATTTVHTVGIIYPTAPTAPCTIAVVARPSKPITIGSTLRLRPVSETHRSIVVCIRGIHATEQHYLSCEAVSERSQEAIRVLVPHEWTRLTRFRAALVVALRGLRLVPDDKEPLPPYVEVRISYGGVEYEGGLDSLLE